MKTQMKTFLNSDFNSGLNANLIADCIDLRHRLHQAPELSNCEFKTRDLLVSELKNAGLEVQTFPNSTAIVALWPGKDRNHSIAFRADMDALPMEETSKLPWSSKNASIMHASGHDGHSTILLGFAKTLAQRGKVYSKDIKFLFQPAEESGNGAKQMVDDGALLNPIVDAVFGLHGWPDLPLGTVGVHDGPVMASVDNFEIKIIGKGGHGAQPHHALDPIYSAAQLIVAAQSLVSRTSDPVESSVLTFGHIEGGKTFNVIPEFCFLQGTLRTHNHSLRSQLKNKLENLTKNLCEGLGLSAQIHWVEGCPPTVNDFAISQSVRGALTALIGSEKCLSPKPSMAGEDFPFFMEQTPGAYIWLGLGQGSGGLHNPNFDFNDRAIEIGIVAFLAILEGQLGKPT